MPALQDILELVGTLDDSEGDNTPRERFRKYLEKSVGTIGAVRDSIETCIRTSGPQYNRALQDLINHAARLIGFSVAFGRYQGGQGQIGYDGLWRLDDFSIVAEVKTTDAYAIKTATLIGCVDQLISDKQIPAWERALGLYVVARPDVALKQLDSAIIAERRTHQLRVATVESILSIAELVQERYITTKEALVLLRPSGVLVDDTVALLARVASQARQEPDELPAPDVSIGSAPPLLQAGARLYLLTPVRDRENATGEKVIRDLLDSGWYVFGDRTPGRKNLKPGDRICFYWSGVGVVADAEVANAPQRKKIGHVREPERFPWAFKVKNARYFDKPVVIDAALRAQLDGFKGRDPDRAWAWFVQGTHPVTEHDFQLLAPSA